ncbi:MAG TPA: glycosyltransferase family 39 protein, partial [Acidobacteriota bacterium]|nr:glycosyltransferase family 39 protein [Acidobacteriota bacterium]
VYVAQAVLDAFSCILLYLILSHYTSTVLALLGAALYAVYPYPGMFCAVLHLDILLVFSVLLVLWLLARASKTPDTIGNWILVGVSVGFAALIKCNMILIAAVPAIVAFSLFGRAAMKKVLIMTFALVLVLLPWIVRNYMAFDAFPPLAVGGTGTNLQYLVQELKGGEEELLRIGSGPATRGLKAFPDGAPLIESEKEMTFNAILYLKEHWPQYLLLTLKHIPRLWITKYSKWHGPMVAAIGQGLSWIVLGFGLVGMFLMRHQFRILLPLYLTVLLVTIIHAPYTTEARYTLPARPVMLFFVAAALTAIATKSSALSRHLSVRNSSIL